MDEIIGVRSGGRTCPMLVSPKVVGIR